MPTKLSCLLERRWGCRVLLGVLMTLTVWTGAWSEARTRGVENASLRPRGAQMDVTVREGSLSVDLREAPVREVLATIGRQAGFSVHIDGAVHHTVSAQFTAMAVDEGLSRLLRMASLSYALLYTRSPATTAILHEVRVFGEERRAEPVDHDQEPIQLAQHAAARLTPPPQEAHGEPQPTEPELEADALAEPEPEADIPED
jgi:hypothetical protein